MNIMSCTPCLQNRILLAACREFLSSLRVFWTITINSGNNDRPMSSGYSHAPTNQNMLNVIPESASYPSHPRYEHSYPHNGHPSRHTGYRPHEPLPWNTPSEYVKCYSRDLDDPNDCLNLVCSTGPEFGDFAHANRTPHEIPIKSFFVERHIMITGSDRLLFHRTPNDYPRMCTYRHSGLDQLPPCIPPV